MPGILPGPCLNSFLPLFAEHFPKPGTKADTRMLKAEEENIEETSSEDSGEEAEDEEAKTPMPPAKANASKATSMKVSASSNFSAPGTKSALNKGNRQAAAVPSKNEEPMKLPSLTSTRGSSIM